MTPRSPEPPELSLATVIKVRAGARLQTVAGIEALVSHMRGSFVKQLLAVLAGKDDELPSRGR